VVNSRTLILVICNFLSRHLVTSPYEGFGTYIGRAATTDIDT